MANIIDYLLWRGDMPFSVDPFNEVDALILTMLSYEDFSRIVPNNANGVDISHAATLFRARHSAEELDTRKDFTRQIPQLLNLMGQATRFTGMQLLHYYSAIEPAFDVQLAILSFLLPDGNVFVAFRGTDSSIVGWKEDFMLSYAPETEGQKRAVEYLNERWSDGNAPLLIGGHSKGGNLAMYASAKCRPEVRNRIHTVYNNDGPGFLDDFIGSDDYRQILPKIKTIVPEFSVVGVLMENEAQQYVVESSATGIMQHDGFSWQVLGNHFIAKEQRNAASQVLNLALSQWLDEQSVENRRVLVQVLFGVLDAAGVQTTHDILTNRAALLSAVRNMQKSIPKEQIGLVLQMMGQLLSIGSGMTVNEVKEALTRRVNTSDILKRE